MPHDFFQYLIEVCRVFVAAKFAGGFDEALRLDLRAVEELLGNRTEIEADNLSLNRVVIRSMSVKLRLTASPSRRKNRSPQ
jgi:hypothetical protein